MKNILIALGGIISVVIVGYAIIHDLKYVPSPAPSYDSLESNNGNMVSQDGRYFTDDRKVSLLLPQGYTYSTSRINSRPTASLVFVATSSKVLLTIDVLWDEDQSYASQEEGVDEFYNEFVTRNGVTINSYTQTSVSKQRIGDYYYAVVDGSRPSSDGYNTDYAKRYITYYGDTAYFIDFVTAWTDAYDPDEFNKIVSTIRFH